MKRDLETSKLYYGFPVFILGYRDEVFGYNVTTCSSSYSLGNQLVVGIVAQENAAKQIQKFREFTLNIPHVEGMVAAEQAGFYSGRDKLGDFDFDYQISTKVDAPILDCCPLTLECKVENVLIENGVCHVIATIVGRKIEEDLLDEKEHLKPDKLSPVYFLGDGYRRVYRYLDAHIESLGSYIKDQKKKHRDS